jgi:hypothetical protein
MTTTIEVSAQGTVRAVRRPGPAPRPPVAYEHRILFREPVYTDGQPYDDDPEDDDGSKWC